MADMYLNTTFHPWANLGVQGPLKGTPVPVELAPALGVGFMCLYATMDEAVEHASDGDKIILVKAVDKS